MEEIQAPKKERKFLKAIGNIAKVLANELIMGIGRKFIGKAIDKVGNKRQGLIIAFVILASTFAFAQYPATGNKQRLGYQTTGDGLVFRGRSNDTTALKPSTLNNAYHLFDTVNNVLFSYIKTKGGWQFNNADTVIVNNNFSQPVDSLFFKTSVSSNNVDTAKMRWDSELGTVVLGMYDKVPNELGFKNFWLVKNQTGSTITKGSLVYANGTVGASGRITVAKFIANGTIDAKYLLGITAHDLSNGEDGYVISFGKIRKVNTDTFAAGAILYPSPTTAGVWTDIEPVAPNIDMPIGFCINSHVNNGTIAIRVASGYTLNELHNVAISSPVEKSSLYYSGGLWRDTTAALLVSDTSSMLTNYLRTGIASSTYTPLSRSISTTSPLQGGGDLSANRTLSILSASDTQSGIVNLTAQLFSGSKVFKHRLTADSLFFLNNLSPIPTHVLGINTTGGVNSVGKFTLGNGLNITSNILQADTALLVTMFDTTSMLLPYLRKADTASMLTPYFRDADTTLLNLTNRFATKLNISDTTNMLTPYFRDADTTSLNLVSRFATKLNISDTSFMLTNYLRSGVAASTYLPLTGGTLTGNLVVNGTTRMIGNVAINTTTAYKPLEVYANANDFISLGVRALGIGQWSGIHFGYVEPNTDYRKSAIVFQRTDYGLGDASGKIHFLNVSPALGSTSANLSYARMTINSNGNVGINDTLPTSTLSVNGTLAVTSTTTLSGALTVNNATVLNEGSGDFDTRIESDGNANMVFVDASTDRVGIGTGSPSKTLDVNGEVKIATMTATPTALLGKDGSNVVGEVTDINQSGVMKVGSITENTSSVGIINVPHGLSYTPTKVIATIAQQSSYVIVCHGITSTNLNFTIYDSTDGTALNNVSVGFFWIAFK
jgi:hypothetical protein